MTFQCFKKNVEFCLFYNMYRFLIQNHLYNDANVVNIWLCLSLINLMADFLAAKSCLCQLMLLEIEQDEHLAATPVLAKSQIIRH